MGNRAVITDDLNGIGVYLHWNGGRDSVEAFLEYCKLKGFRSPKEDKSYAYARLCQVIGNYFGGGLSIGVDLCDNLDCDNYDNGVYIIDGWDIVDRKFFSGEEQNEYNRAKMLKEIDNAQPKDERLGALLDAQEVPIEQVQVGDTVIVQSGYDGNFGRAKVVGIGEDRFVNGTNVNGIPYTNLYHGGDNNINNYLRGDTARVLK